MLIFSLIFLNIIFCVNAEKHEMNSKAALDLFSLLIKSLSNAVPQSVQGAVNLAYVCQEGSIPKTFSTDSKGMPFVFCKEVDCLEANKIQCSSNISMELCQGEKQWINGFHENFSNGHNSTKVECCQYNDDINMKFVRNFNVTKDQAFTREEFHKNGKMVGFNVFNNVEMHGNNKNETIYSISVYQMTCPRGAKAKTAVSKSNSNEASDDEKLESLKNIASSAREIGFKVRNSKPKPMPSFSDRDQLLSEMASRYANFSNPYDGIIATRTENKLPPPPVVGVVSNVPNRNNEDTFGQGQSRPIVHKLKWDIYNPKKRFPPQQHVFSNAPEPAVFELME